MFNSYEDKKKHEYRLAIMNACSALEICLINRIKDYCITHNIDDDILLKKYRYLSDLIDLTKNIDLSFSSLDTSNIAKIRNGIAHPKGNITIGPKESHEVVLKVDCVLKYFYNDNFCL